MSSRRHSTISVAVCGLTSSSYPGLSGQGAGKSCLCNRFVRPKKDDLKLNHHSVLNHSEFGTNVINNTHFLYWGEKVVGLEDGQDVTFQILEHTEFVDDSSLKPFSFTKPYYKRCTQLKLQSGGKVTYIEPDQLSLPEQYTDVGKFPDKFIVDGFIVCVDVSLDFEKPGNPQWDFFDKLLHNVISTKKPVVVACTKFDRALDHSVVAVNEMVLKTKRHVPVIEVSALKGVNVDLCFLILCHLVDTKKPRTRITTYSDAKQHLDDRIRKNEYSFQYVLDNKLTDFSMSVEAASTMLHNEVEFQLLRELCGIERLHKLVRAKLNYLKKEAVEKKLAHTLEQLPAVLDTLLPELPLEASVDSCVRMLKEREKSMECLVDLDNWREDDEYLKKTTVVVPLSLFSEEQGREILQKHIDKVLTSIRAEVACERLQKALESSTGLLPGGNMYDVFNELGISEEVSRIPEERLMKLYQDHMVHVEQECVSDVKELLLERSDLFAQLDTADVLERVDQELASCDRYRRLDKRPDLRKSTVIKHIANLQWPDKGPYGKSHLLEVLQSESPSKDSLVPPSHPISSDNLQWVLAPDDQVFNLAILARTETNALTLRSDFMNHLSGQGTCKVNDRRYQLEMRLFQGPQRSLTNKDFVPQGAVAVVTSMECLDWLDDLLNELWIPGGNTKPHYRGMPLVILAVDECIEEDYTSNTNGNNADSELWKRAKLLAHRVQSVCITEHLPIVPKRLVVTNVIHTLLVSLVDSVKQCDRFLNSDLSLEPEGLNIAMFNLTGDPYPNLHMLSLWLDHQLVWFSERNNCLFLRAAIDKQHRTCSISFHSALNTMNLKSSIRLGFILVYSAERPASLAVIRSLLAKLPKIPILLVAMATEGSRDNQLLKEGRGLAEQWNASFVSSSEPAWSIEHISEFFSKCWFSRFSSWNAQDVPEEVKQRLRRRKPEALPDRPLPSHPSSLREPTTSSSLPNRHSFAAELPEAHTPTHPLLPSGGSLPRPPSRHNYKYTLPPTTPEGDATYSSPQELGIGVQQKKAATLERKRKKSNSDNSSRVSFPFPLQLEDENSEYARVADHVKMSPHLMGSLKRPLKSPTFPAPPPPVRTTSTHPPINGQLREEEGEDEKSKQYAQPHRRTPLSPKERGYDHLAQMRYDHLAPKEYPSNNIVTQPTENTETYATIEDNRKMLRQEAAPSCTYATIDESRKMPHVPAPRKGGHLAYTSPAAQRRRISDNPQQNDGGDHLYSVVNKPRRQRSADDVLQNVPPVVKYPQANSPPMKPMRRYTPEAAPEDLYTLPDKSKNQREATQSHLDEPQSDFHSNSLPDRRRKAQPSDFHSLPDRSKRAVKRPPVVAPKPKVDRAKRSPTPNAQASSRSESPDTLAKPSLLKQILSSPKSRRKKEQQQLEQGKSKPVQRYTPEAASEDLYTLPDKKLGNLAAEAANKASSLPRDRVWSDGARGRIRGRDNVGLGERVGSLDDNRYVGTESRQYEGLSSGDELEEEEDAPKPDLPQRNYSLSELGLKDEPPPIPDRNYSWSDVEDNDDELFQSDDDLDDPPAKMSVSDHLAIYASIQRYKRASTRGMEDIYNVVNRMAHGEKTPQKVSPQESEAAFSVYDTLQNVIRSMPTKSSNPTTPAPEEKGGKREEPKKKKREDEAQERSSAAASPVPAAPFTSREVKLIKQQQKLLEKLEKKANKEAERRRKQEAKRRRREEDEQRKREGRKKVKRPRGHKESERQRYFGSPLEMVAGSDGVPVFVRQCIDIIEKKGLKAEGLYRVSGKKEDCLALQQKIDEDFNLDVASLGYYENVISSTLKAFFKLLPDPLISDEVSAKILAVNSLPMEAQQAKLHEVLTATMPLPNLKTLRCLVTHLHHVQEYEEFNKMSASNLAIVFWPTLMRPPLLDLADPSKQLGWQMAMTQIIEHPEFVPKL